MLPGDTKLITHQDIPYPCSGQDVQFTPKEQLAEDKSFAKRRRLRKAEKDEGTVQRTRSVLLYSTNGERWFKESRVNEALAISRNGVRTA